MLKVKFSSLAFELLLDSVMALQKYCSQPLSHHRDNYLQSESAGEEKKKSIHALNTSHNCFSPCRCMLALTSISSLRTLLRNLRDEICHQCPCGFSLSLCAWWGKMSTATQLDCISQIFSKYSPSPISFYILLFFTPLHLFLSVNTILYIGLLNKLNGSLYWSITK